MSEPKQCKHIMAGTDGERCWLEAGHPGYHERSPDLEERAKKEWTPGASGGRVEDITLDAALPKLGNHLMRRGEYSDFLKLYFGRIQVLIERRLRELWYQVGEILGEAPNG